ncbi:TrbI/VirB10 family protein [Pandoraea sp.]|uniref:TrbI/VirB10 family protein n=1 Tax=Pandoraea sp. TaxID=1883445 RepID=UPI0012089819|nr:TrbI/VirB10 family protein [Pandoraea sp.]TAL56912.1 MAG: TrbI/VirB10 family protein [Pandoraea sp.]TAM17706.1 MAG: TrbI/VirB10 family protein [Pandoraea sp.]
MAEPPRIRSTGPQKLTRTRRNLLQVALVVLVVSMIVILVARHLFGPHQTLSQQAAKRAQDALANQPAGRPEEMRDQLDHQELVALDRLQAQIRARRPPPGAPPASASAPSGAARPGPLPAQFQVPPTESNADKLALARAQKVLQTRSIGAWEADSRGAKPAAPADSTLDLLKRLVPFAHAHTAPGVSPDGSPEAALARAELAAAGQAGRSGQVAADRRWLSDAQASATHDTYSPLVPSPAQSPYALLEGDVIKAVVLQAMNTDKPGTVRAMVIRDIYDTVNARDVVMPAGTVLIGTQDTDIAAGQDRILMAFNRVRFPSGATLTLGGLPGADVSGAAGLPADEVNSHFWEQFGSSFLIAGVAALAGGNSSSRGVTINVSGANPAGSLSQAAAQGLSDTVQHILQRNQTIKPTLSVDPGDEITIIVTREMDLPPDIVNRNAS